MTPLCVLELERWGERGGGKHNSGSRKVEANRSHVCKQHWREIERWREREREMRIGRVHLYEADTRNVEGPFPPILLAHTNKRRSLFQPPTLGFA